jgi:RNase P/RNase MRP subunit POP5
MSHRQFNKKSWLINLGLSGTKHKLEKKVKINPKETQYEDADGHGVSSSSSFVDVVRHSGTIKGEKFPNYLFLEPLDP